MERLIKKLEQNDTTKQEIIEEVKKIKPEAPIVQQKQVDLSPLVASVTAMKNSIDVLANKKDENSELTAEVLIEYIPEAMDSIK
jgi:hypothetical protein